MPNTLSSNRPITALPTDNDDDFTPINLNEFDSVPSPKPSVATQPTVIHPKKVLPVAPVPPSQPVVPAAMKSPNLDKLAVPALEEKPPTIGKRVLNMLLVGLIYGLIGVLIDWVINLVKVTGSTHSSGMLWFFSYVLLILGLVLGWFFGNRALNAIFGLFTSNANRFDDSDVFSAGILRAIGIGLVFGVVSWLLLMLFV